MIELHVDLLTVWQTNDAPPVRKRRTVLIDEFDADPGESTGLPRMRRFTELHGDRLYIGALSPSTA